MARSKRSKGLKDPKYLAWIRSLGCCVCAVTVRAVSVSNYQVRTQLITQTTVTEAAHVGARGLSQKCSDLETIPLCAQHHRTGRDSQHVLGKNFWEHHGLDREELIKQLNERYEAEKAA